MGFEFEVRFISPLLIGGANSNDRDSQGLSASSLRGCWRFWCRAILGGSIEAPTDYNLMQKLENDLFGSTQKSIFRLSVKRISHQPDRFFRLPHKQGSARALRPGFRENARYSVIVRPRPGDFDNVKEAALLGIIWLWGYLGAVGNRSRRGFGCPVLAPVEGRPDPFVIKNLPLQLSFTDTQELIEYLGNGITNARSLVNRWLTAQSISTRSNTFFNDDSVPIGSFNFFTINSLNQIAVSNRSFADLGCLESLSSATGAIGTVHGDRNATPELGYANPHGRLASPAFIRLHLVNNEWVPVCTWSKFINNPDNGLAAQYLRGIGLQHSLLGVPW